MFKSLSKRNNRQKKYLFFKHLAVQNQPISQSNIADRAPRENEEEIMHVSDHEDLVECVSERGNVEETDAIIMEDENHANILQDEDFCAQIAEFGVSKEIFASKNDLLKSKLQKWYVNNLRNMRRKAVNELLEILSEEGYNLPKTAAALAQTVHSQNLQDMLSKRGNLGKYAHLGIESGILKQLNGLDYQNETISVIINIDGAKCYQIGRLQVWRVLIKIHDEKYQCDPFISSIFCGDSKPASVHDFLRDFICEANKLTDVGIQLNRKKYNFKIVAFVCDTPARAWLKCAMGHNGFNSCERCQVKGITVNKRRVFPIKGIARCHNSFKMKKDAAHHQPNMTSPLLELKNFDIVKQFLLDSMHLLFLGITKFLLEKLFLKGPFLIKKKKRDKISKLMKKLEKDIPEEFQRKKIPIDDVTFWKATQFRFFLLYCGAFVFAKYLSSSYYKHYMLFFVTARILCSKDLVSTHAEYAKKLAEKFFELFPSLYGRDSQVMNIHNIIHVIDDAIFLKASLSQFCAFPFENFLGLLKDYVHSPNKPLEQILNRIADKEKVQDQTLKKYKIIRECKFGDFKHGWFEILQISLRDITLRNTHPNNVIKLKEKDTLLQITKISSKTMTPVSLNEIYIDGYEIHSAGPAFDYPCTSTVFDIFKIGNQGEVMSNISAENIETKYVVLNVKADKIGLPMLHVQMSD